MQAIHIGQKKGSFFLTTAILLSVLIGFGYYVFLSGNTQVKSTHTYVFAALVIYSVYTIYFEARIHFRSIPKLIISDISIEVINYHKTKLFLWQDVTNWHLENDEGTDYLVIEANGNKERVRISSLEKKPHEIKQIIKKVKLR